MKLKVQKIHNDAKLPLQARHGDAGMDLFSIDTIEIKPGHRKMVKTGIKIELEEGYEAQVRPRSGLALKYGVTVLNSPGTIDAGYRGEIGVILINHGQEVFAVEKSMRIAQLVIQTIPTVELVEVEELSQSERGEKGFGSSGTK